MPREHFRVKHFVLYTVRTMAHHPYRSLCGSLRLRRLLPLLLTGFAAWIASPAPAGRAFEWAGRLRATAQKLRSPRASVRLAAVHALGGQPIASTKPWLLRATADTDDQVRVEAARVLVRHRVNAVMPVLVEWLADFSVQVRVEAARLLGQLGNAAAVPPLIRAFGDFEHTVRMAAVKALGQLGSRRAVTGILGRLYDPNVKVRRAAIGVLADLADQRSVIPLLGKLTDPSREIRTAAVKALTRIADPRATIPIIRLLGDPAPKVRVAAIEALGRLRPPGATPALVRALRRSTTPSERTALLHTLAKLSNPQARAALLRALLRRHPTAGLESAIAEAGRPMVPLLISVLGSPRTHARQAASIVRILRRIGDRRASRVLVAEFQRERVTRRLVVEALSTCGDGSAVVPLLRMLGTAPPTEKPLILRALEPIVDGRAASALLPLLGDPSLDLRRSAVRMLGRLRARAAVRPLLALLHHADPHLVRLAIRALGHIGDPSAGAALVPLLFQAIPQIRRAARNALAQLRPEGQISPLLKRAEDPDATVTDRVLALDVLASIVRNRRAPQLVAPVSRFLSDPSPSVVAGALTIAGASAEPAFAPPLRGRLARLPVTLRPSAVDALGRFRDAASTAVLLHAARDPAWQVRAAAAWALSGRPQALPVLVHLMADPHLAVRTNAAGALARPFGAKTPSQALPPLRALLAKQSLDPFLRTNVALALGRARDHRSVAALQALLASPTTTNRYLVGGLARALLALGVPADALRQRLAKRADPILESLLRARSTAKHPVPSRRQAPWRRWIGITVVGDQGIPTPGSSVHIILPDGRVRWCVSDVRGQVVLERLPPGDHVDYEQIARPGK